MSYTDWIGSPNAIARVNQDRHHTIDNNTNNITNCQAIPASSQDQTVTSELNDSKLPIVDEKPPKYDPPPSYNEATKT